MEKRNPRANARASVSIAADTDSLSQHHPVIQANAAARRRHAWLMRFAPYFAEARHV